MNIRIIWTPCLQTGCFPTVNHMCICVIYIYVLCMNDKLTCVLCVLNAHRTQTVIESEKQNTHCYCAFVCSQIRCSGYSCSSRSKTQYTHSIHSQIAYKQAEHNNKPSSCMYCACVCVMQLSLPVRRVSSIVSMLDICVKCIIHWWEWNKYVAALFIVVQFSVLLLPLIWKSHRCVNIIIASHSAIKSELDIGSPCRRCSAHLPRNYPSTFCIHFIQFISAEIFCCPKHMTDCARPRPFTKLIDIRAVIRSARGSNVIN